MQKLQKRRGKLRRRLQNSQNNSEKKLQQRRFVICHPKRSVILSTDFTPKREAKNDFAREFYGKLPLNQSQSRPGVLRHQIASLSSELDGKTVVIRARVHTLRGQGNKVFLKLRQRTDSVQALLSVEEGKVSKLMVKWAAGLSSENIVLVEGIVQKSPEEIKDATIKDVELVLTRVRTSAKMILSGLC